MALGHFIERHLIDGHFIDNKIIDIGHFIERTFHKKIIDRTFHSKKIMDWTFL